MQKQKKAYIKNIVSFIKSNRAFVIILLFAFLIRIIYFFYYHELLWDEGVYIGMGKFIFSFGSAGLWEHIRPIVLPVLLGFGWLLNLEPVVFGRALGLFFSLAIITLTYLIALHLFDKRTAVLATALLSFSGMLFYMGFHTYTEVPSVLFALLGIYLFMKKRHYLAGLLLGVSFLTKFPAGIFILPALILILIEKKRREFTILLAGFLTAALPYLLLNYFLYGNTMLPIVEAKQVIEKVLGCNVFRYNPWWHYFYSGFKDNILNVFSIAGAFFMLKKFKKLNLLIILSFVLPLIYFTQLHCRDFRYMLMFLPFLSVLSGYGIYGISELLAKRKKAKHIGLIIALVVAVSLFQGIYFYYYTEPNFISQQELGYLRFLENKPVKGEVWSSNPLISVYTDAKLNKFYYPVYDSNVSASFFKYLTASGAKISYVFMDNCGGGIICHPNDSLCKEQTEKIIDYLDKNMKKVYDEKLEECYYVVYKN